MAFIQNELETIHKKVQLTRNCLYQIVNPISGQSQVLNQNNSQVMQWINDESFYNDKILNKGQENTQKNQKSKIMMKKRENDPINQYPLKNNLVRQRKTLSIEMLAYEQLQPLHTLWEEYISSLLVNEKIQENIYLKLIKADLNGSSLQVCYAKCKDYEGIQGIVIEERLKSFTLITNKNERLCILKENSIFLLPTPMGCFKIYGFHLIYRPADRVKTKFKFHQANKFVSAVLSEYQQI